MFVLLFVNWLEDGSKCTKVSLLKGEFLISGIKVLDNYYIGWIGGGEGTDWILFAQ